jgi:chromosome segregation ATPase
MVAQLAATPKESSSTTTSAVKSELQKMREYCLRLNEALEAERAKSSKLRQYIARLNSARPQTTKETPAPPVALKANDSSIQTLVEDQTRLLEQLYSENQKQRSELTELENRVQQLLTANDKLKARNIELRRQLKPLQSVDREAAPTKEKAVVIEEKTKPAIEVSSEDKQATGRDAGGQRRWFRFALIKN